MYVTLSVSTTHNGRCHIECPEVTTVDVNSSSSIYWTGPFPGVKSPIKACALGVGGGVCSFKTANIKNKIYFKTLIKLFYEPLVI